MKTREIILAAANEVEKPSAYNFNNPSANNIDAFRYTGLSGFCALGWMYQCAPKEDTKHIPSVPAFIGRYVPVALVSEALLGMSEHEFYQKMDALEGSMEWKVSGKVAARVLRKFADRYYPEIA